MNKHSAPPHSPLHAGKSGSLTLTQLGEKLRHAGINPTAQRLAICRYVLCEADHPSAEQVKAWVDRNFPKMSLATVYNTLKTLVDAGLLKELRFPHSESALYDCNTGPHFHFLDQKTGRVIDIAPECIKVDVRALKRDYKISAVDVLIQGERAT